LLLSPFLFGFHVLDCLFKSTSSIFSRASSSVSHITGSRPLALRYLFAISETNLRARYERSNHPSTETCFFLRFYLNETSLPRSYRRSRQRTDKRRVRLGFYLIRLYLLAFIRYRISPAIQDSLIL